MGWINIPTELTEEEKLLKQKYRKLARKKKQVEQLHAPKVEEEKPTPIPLKRAISNPKEVYKKLLQSGAISAIKAPERKDAGFVRKRSASDRIAGDRPGGYRPFSASNSTDSDMDGLDDVFVGTPSDPNPAPNSRSDPYSMYGPSVVSAKDAEVIAREETIREKKREGKAHYVNRDLPNQGNTVYVRGVGVSEDALRTEFSLHGSIVQIVIESEKNCAFVTFETIEEANRAIEQVNGMTLEGVKVAVSLARRQIKVQKNSSTASSSTRSQPSSSSTETSSTSSGSSSWATLAANYYKEDKEVASQFNTKPRRQLVAYDEVPDDF